MKREAVITSLLLVNACLLIYVAVLMNQKPTLQEIDARIEFWHQYYEVQLKQLRKNRQAEEIEKPSGVSVTDQFRQPLAPEPAESGEMPDADAATKPKDE